MTNENNNQTLLTYSGVSKFYGITDPEKLMRTLGIEFDINQKEYVVKNRRFKSFDEALTHAHIGKNTDRTTGDELPEKPTSNDDAIDHPDQQDSPYPIFSRKQLAWMGLITGALLLILLNVEFSHSRSLMEQFARESASYGSRESAYWISNAVLVGLIWFSRVHLGALFAFVVGVFLNLVSQFAKKV